LQLGTGGRSNFDVIVSIVNEKGPKLVIVNRDRPQRSILIVI